MAHARRMRRRKTLAEEMLWQELRANQLQVRFRAQFPIGRCIVDFVCLERRLVVEVDGGVHETPEAAAADAARTTELTNLGYRVIRFTNHQVYVDIWEVVADITEALRVGERLPLVPPGGAEGGATPELPPHGGSHYPRRGEAATACSPLGAEGGGPRQNCPPQRQPNQRRGKAAAACSPRGAEGGATLELPPRLGLQVFWRKPGT